MGPERLYSNELPREAVAAATRAGARLHSLLIGPAWDRGNWDISHKNSQGFFFFSCAGEGGEGPGLSWRVLSPAHPSTQFKNKGVSSLPGAFFFL